jgi:hypothetical protein
MLRPAKASPMPDGKSWKKDLEAIERLRAEHERLGERISAMYIDRLDGKIGGDFHDKFAGE